MAATVYRTPLDGKIHNFRLTDSGIQSLDHRLSVRAMLQSLVEHRWHIMDIKMILTLGLSGAGMRYAEAHATVQEAVTAGNLANCAQVATMVLGAAIFGLKEDGSLNIEGDNE